MASRTQPSHVEHIAGVEASGVEVVVAELVGGAVLAVDDAVGAFGQVGFQRVGGGAAGEGVVEVGGVDVELEVEGG